MTNNILPYLEVKVYLKADEIKELWPCLNDYVVLVTGFAGSFSAIVSTEELTQVLFPS